MDFAYLELFEYFTKMKEGILINKIKINNNFYIFIFKFKVFQSYFS